MYITIDENRSRVTTLSGYAGKSTPNALKVDCDAPTRSSTLKENYTEYSGEEQWNIIPDPVPPVYYPKLSIRRAMRELGIESKLDDLLNSSPEFQKDWADVVSGIDLNDPVTKAALNAGTISDEEIQNIKNQIKG